MIAHYYNTDAARNGGAPQVVYTCKRQIACVDVTAFDPPVVAKQFIPAVEAGADGAIVLKPDDVELHGSLQTESHGGQPNIGFWDNAGDWASWKVKFPAAGIAEVAVKPADAAAWKAINLRNVKLTTVK